MAQFKQFLMEGGNAVAVASRINQRNVAATLEDIYKSVLPEFKIKKSDTDAYALLGSAGKKKDDDSSGDLDIAVGLDHVKKAFKLKTDEDASKKMQEIVTDLATKIHKEHGHDGQAIKDFFKIMTGLQTFSFGFPIHNTDGKQEGLFVQVDIMATESIDLAGWALSAPHYSESPTKGAVRVILLSQMLKHSQMKVIEKDDEGQPAIWERYYLDPKKGLFFARQERKMGKNGKYTKSSSIVEKKLVTADKDKIIQFLFGPKHKAKDVMTFEKLWDLFNSNDFKYPAQRAEIKKAFKENMDEQGLEVPKQ